MYKIKEFLNSLEHYELMHLRQELEKGKLSLLKEIQEKIKELEKQHGGICATCSNDLDPYNSNSYTIMFGQEDFKKKASFCGLDCLEYFLAHLKKIKGAEKTEFSGTSNRGDKNAEKIE